ncbi:lipopolysaccharide biosynthesis protein [Marinobacter sp. F4216]|uniref:lipopolysaccharide biosynthesis protein n=1 Tax=Marinobacter sp. F4216 TaxID=2874281 RepID=UPI001CBBD38D|nr:oligosaccharide flippase family protein [Marinobacter sp. F4216]MBZ2168421.1 oligosaccharide flippase family protein [Marinobacter sp. F4216]
MSIRSRFLKLLLGPAITLVVGVLSGPIISRLFNPEDFGRYSVLLGIIGVGAVAVTARFEQLIPSSKDPAANFWIVLATSILGALLLGFGAYSFFSLQEAVFVALTTLSVAIFNAFYYLLIVTDRSLRASGGRALQAGGVLGGQVALGSSGWAMPGLMWGELSGRLLSLVLVFQRIEFRKKPEIFRAIRDQLPTAKWLLPGALLGALALQLLPLGMASSVGAAAAGVFLLIYRMVVIPNALLSKVASDTLLVELSRLERQGMSIHAVVESSLARLVLTAVCLYGSLSIYGGWFFAFILGEGWESGTQLIPWLSILVGFWSIASPLAMVFVSLEKTKWSFRLSALDILNRFFALVVGYLAQDVVLATISLAIGGGVVYGLSVKCALSLANASFARSLNPVLPHLLLVALLLLGSWVLFTSGFWLLACSLTVIAFLIAGKRVVYG